jgi:hypothetical protein
MRMKIEQVGLGPADTGKIRACFEVSLAAERVDEPEGRGSPSDRSPAG